MTARRPGERSWGDGQLSRELPSSRPFRQEVGRSGEDGTGHNSGLAAPCDGNDRQSSSASQQNPSRRLPLRKKRDTDQEDSGESGNDREP